MALGALSAFACSLEGSTCPISNELRCKECGKNVGNSPRSFCEECFSPLEVSFDYDSLKKSVRREDLASRKFNMWRYAEFLPLQDGYATRGDIGGTPLIASSKLAAHWGVKNLFLKNDAGVLPFAIL